MINKSQQEQASLYVLGALNDRERQTFEADQKSLVNNAVTFDRVIRDYRTLLNLELGYHRARGQLAMTLARIRQAMTTLPRVEVVGLADPTKPLVITHAELVGWIDDGQLLVVQEGRLAVYSASGAKLKGTAIAAKANAAWLR